MADGKPRGNCPVCGRSIQLKKDGTVRHHGGGASDNWPYRRAHRCSGSDEKPLTSNPF
jgi:hypothetical protein